MTAVSGKKDLKSCAATDDDLTPEVLDGIGRAFTAAMQESWSHGQLHGDLALQNILYDVQGRNLSFIDPGTRECCTVCHDLTKRWRPAVLELGHILRDLGTDVRDMIGNPIARFRRQIFAESALRAFIETIGSFDEKQRALDEIQACAQVHLSRVLEPSWSLRGLWRWLLTQLVVRRMASMLDGLRSESHTPTDRLKNRPMHFSPKRNELMCDGGTESIHDHAMRWIVGEPLIAEDAVDPTINAAETQERRRVSAST